jgi:hypothetical protein
MSRRPKGRQLASAALSAVLGAVLVALSGGGALAAPTSEPATQPTGQAAGSTDGALPPLPEAAPPTPSQTAAIPDSAQSATSVTHERADQTAGPGTAASADALDAEAAAQAAAIREAGSNSGGSQTGTEANRLSIYGFSDFTYVKPISTFGFYPASTFAVGNLNVYMGADIAKDWRSLIEIRFMYLPDGSKPLGTSGMGTDTTTADYVNEYRPIKWGGISIQRAWVERTFHKLLTIRVGQFLTPYGIWNVDHGSPVFIGVAKPYVVGQQYLPESQTGI